MQSKSQSGFSHIVLVFILVVIAAIGFAGWRVMGSRKHAPKTIPASAQTSKSSIPLDGETRTQAAPQVAEYQNEELGFKYQVPLTWPHEDPAVFPVADYSHATEAGILRYDAATKQWIDQNNTSKQRIIYTFGTGQINPYGLGLDTKSCREIFTFVIKDKMVEVAIPPSPADVQAKCSKDSPYAAPDNTYDAKREQFLNSISQL